MNDTSLQKTGQFRVIVWVAKGPAIETNVFAEIPGVFFIQSPRSLVWSDIKDPFMACLAIENDVDRPAGKKERE